jgi:hypothetical protein
MRVSGTIMRARPTHAGESAPQGIGIFRRAMLPIQARPPTATDAHTRGGRGPKNTRKPPSMATCYWFAVYTWCHTPCHACHDVTGGVTHDVRETAGTFQ